MASRLGCLRSSLPCAGQHLDRDWTQTSLLVRSHEPLPASASSFALSGATAATPTAVASEATGTEIAISVISACACARATGWFGWLADLVCLQQYTAECGRHNKQTRGK